MMKTMLRRLAAIMMVGAMLFSEAMAATATVKNGSLRLRKAASQTSRTLQTLEEGTEMEILAVSGDWYKVRFGRYTGYVMSKYVKVSGELPEEKSSSSVKDDGTLRPGSSGSAVKALQTKLKALGFYSGSIDGDYGNGTKAAVKAFQKKYGLTADGVAGAKTLDKLASVSSGNSAGSSSGSTAAADKTEYDTLRPGDVCSAVRQMQKRLKELGYYSGSVDASYGKGTRSAVEAFQKQNGLAADGVAGPATQKLLYSDKAEKAKEEEVDLTLRPGDNGAKVKELQNRLKALGYAISSVDGDYGAATEAAVKAFQKENGLAADGVAGAGTQAVLFSSDAKKADDGSLRPGDSGSEVKALQNRLKKLGYYDGSADGDYGEATEAAVKAFQKKNGLTADGVAGASTLAKMNSDDVVDNIIETESLNWFKNGDSAIPKHAVFTVKDVKTGKTFRVRRWSGVNHADSEPLTSADTAIMKEIYGGSWSWTRRAILVSYNGHVYAASMNGMPHGTTTINNGFDGHFCIHFTNSRTHGTDRVDEDHQACVKNALQAEW